MAKMICFDMDGTIAGFYSVPNWLDKLEKEDASPYREAKPLWNMSELRKILISLIEKGWEVRVISWLAKDSSESYKSEVRRAKLEWLAKYDFPYRRCHLVAYGTTKADCVRRYYDEQPMILIDDNDKVREGWHLGETINPTEVDLIEELKILL